MRRTLIVLAVLLVSPSLPVARDAAVERLLDRTARYVDQFQTEFSHVIGTEHYSQAQRTAQSSRTRALISEVFFFGRTDQVGAMTVRNVQRVDGRRVSKRSDAVERALALPAAERVATLRALANAGARYNLGTLQRNFNEPTLALMFVSAEFQPRFKFKIDGQEVVDGLTLRRVVYRETTRPTVIRDARKGTSIPASGSMLVDDEGTVWRTTLRLDTGEVRAVIGVAYSRDARLGVVVPSTMDEDYRHRDTETVRPVSITGHAVYSDYRRFVTSGRIVSGTAP